MLREWQKDFILNVYGPVVAKGLELTRRIRRALLSIARKNGKSALAAALVLVHLCGPEAVQNGEVYSAASDRDQAANIYKMVAQMIELDPELSQMCKCLESVKRVVCYPLGTFYRAMAADARRLHGFNPTFVIYDELAQAKNRELYDVLSTSFGAREEALMLVISTQNNEPAHIMTELVDDALAQARGELEDPYFYGKVYQVPENADPFDEKNWILANPALGDFRDIIDMRSQAEKAKRSPSAGAAFKNLLCNMRVDAIEGLITGEDWRACQHKIDFSELRGLPFYGAIDLSQRQDLTAFVGVWDRGSDFVIRPWFWTPEYNLESREKADGARYREWQERGFLEVVPGRTVNFGHVAKRIEEITGREELESIAFDRWRIDQLREEAEKAGIDVERWNLAEVGQGFKDMSPAIEKLEALAVAHQIAHDGNPVLTYCLANVLVINDPAGNRKFDKRRKNRRIDGAVALAMALSLVDSAPEREIPVISVYETRGIRSV